MSLPIFNTALRELSMMQTQWASELNPLLSQPLSTSIILKNVVLKTGANNINHLLARNQQGWLISDINSPVTIYRSKPLNDTTLTLTSSGPATINLIVF